MYLYVTRSARVVFQSLSFEDQLNKCKLICTLSSSREWLQHVLFSSLPSQQVDLTVVTSTEKQRHPNYSQNLRQNLQPDQSQNAKNCAHFTLKILTINVSSRNVPIKRFTSMPRIHCISFRSFLQQKTYQLKYIRNITSTVFQFIIPTYVLHLLGNSLS